ncbi:MAG: hypothetical protein HQK77_07055 [Desulfobacterales bacterium]|nr:hypothetical protein [Desulfobacterales bacterium]
MKQHDEVSATEKLLNVIRGKRIEKTEQVNIKEKVSKSTQRKSIPSARRLLARRVVTIGILVGYNDIILVKMLGTKERINFIPACIRTKMPDGINKEHPEFPNFLKKTLLEFTSGIKPANMQLWSLIPSTDVETRYLRIPKVSASKISNAVYWTYKKIVTFEDNTVIFDYEIIGEVKEKNVTKLEAVAYTAPQKEIKKLQDTFIKVGFPLTGISIIAFAFQNMIRRHWLSEQSKNICTLFIGKDWSRIDIFLNGNLILSRDIKTGMSSLIDTLRDELNTANAMQTHMDSPEEILTLDNENLLTQNEPSKAIDSDAARKLLWDHIRNQSNQSNASQLSLKTDMFLMILPAVERLVRQIERTLEYFGANYTGGAIGKLYVSGVITDYQRLIDFIAEQLNIPAEPMNPFSTSIIPLDHLETPKSISERDTYTPAIGIALSHNDYTPNFLWTYKHKEAKQQTRILNLGIFSVFVIIIAVCTGVFIWQNHVLNQKKLKHKHLEDQLESFSPKIDKDMIMQMVLDSQQFIKKMQHYSEMHYGISLIYELINKTPDHIQLIDIQLILAKEAGKEKESQYMIVEGFLLGMKNELDASLANYRLKLDSSSLFIKVNATKKETGSTKKIDFLRFLIRIELA